MFNMSSGIPYGGGGLVLCIFDNIDMGNSIRMLCIHIISAMCHVNKVQSTMHKCRCIHNHIPVFQQ